MLSEGAMSCFCYFKSGFHPNAFAIPFFGGSASVVAGVSACLSSGLRSRASEKRYRTGPQRATSQRAETLRCVLRSLPQSLLRSRTTGTWFEGCLQKALPCCERHSCQRRPGSGDHPYRTREDAGFPQRPHRTAARRLAGLYAHFVIAKTDLVTLEVQSRFPQPPTIAPARDRI